MAHRPIIRPGNIGFCPLQGVEAGADEVRTEVIGQDRYTWWHCLACLGWHLYCCERNDDDSIENNPEFEK